MKRIGISLILCTATLLSTLSGCSGRQDTATEPGFISVTYKDLPDKGTVNLSELFEEPEFIALDSRTTDAYYTGGVNAVSDRYIGMSGGYYQEKPYKLYDRATGEYLGTVGNVGRGPGEYLFVLNSFIDDNSGRIWLYDTPEKLYTYDLKTREFIGEVPLAYNLGDYNYSKSDFIINQKEGTITCARVPYPEDKDTIVAWKQDFDGKVIWAISERNRGMASSNMEALGMWNMSCSKNIRDSLDISFRTTDAAKDTLFMAENGKMTPVFHIEIKNQTSSSPIPATISTSTIIPGKILTCILSSGLENGGVINYTPTQTVITDRTSGEAYKCDILDDYMGSGTVFPSPSYGYMIITYDPLSFREAAAVALESGKLSDTAKEKVRTILSGLSDNDNNILALYRIK